MFASVLIANRGEIACRIARTARRLGLRAIAVYSQADAGAPHVRQCDEAHLIGPAPARESYLAIEKLIELARTTRAECIHPGYGFLSENPDFAQACAAAGIVFVGPPAAAIRAMGHKDRAKMLMQDAGVPVVPGYHGTQQDVDFLAGRAAAIGYPVLIKAVAGGGGKGMRRVDRDTEFATALASAQREAASAFDDARVLIEKFIVAPRHIEVQVFADTHGNAVHLHERDCSLQRRHQKVMEEAPAPGMTPALRAAMGDTAVTAAKAVGYVGAGTVEFIAEGSLAHFWFMEMNTRLQVEHPVTEAITGLDLVEWQFRVAAGERLPLAQSEIPLAGHAVEARLYAEDPEHEFLPSTGRLIALELPAPEGIRIDTGVEEGSEVTPFYDPMIAKVIAHADTRSAALDRLAGALDRAIVAGPRSNVAFLAALCRAGEFRAGMFDTGFIERNLAALGAVPQLDRAAAALGALRLIDRDMARLAELHGEEPGSPWDATDGFQLSGARQIAIPILVDGDGAMASIEHGEKGLAVTVDGVGPGDGVLVENAAAVHVLRRGRQTVVSRRAHAPIDFDHGDGDGVVRAPMHGKVLAVLVERGETVTKGQRLAIIEAMKMEHTLTAPVAGTISDIWAGVGKQVAERAPVMAVRPADP